MSKTVVDARGKSCPQPVIDTRKALAELGAAQIEVLVDRQSAAENVARKAATFHICETLYASGVNRTA